jgi:GT2 family glycosyltransferase
LTWNDGELLDVALASILGSTGVDVEVVVVDNGSDPPAQIGSDVRVTLIRNVENRGVAPARNQGVRATSAEVVALVDSDARVGPRALAQLTNAVLADSTIGLAGPVFVGQEPEASGGGAPTLFRKLARAAGLVSTYRSMSPRQPVDAWDVDFVIGACQAFRRSAFDGVSGLDERYFYGPEDVDFCLRLRGAGWRVVQVPDVEVHHPPRRRHRSMFNKAGLLHARNVIRHLWRHRRR